MARLNEIRATSRWTDMLEGQFQHLGMAILLSLGALSLLSETPDARLLGLTAYQWAIASIVLAIGHQAVVAVVFRLQLHRNWLTDIYGESDMRVWAMIFMPLLIARPVSLILIGWADTTPITGFRTAEIILGLMLLAPAIWAMHSTFVHFTLPRALGGDHFRDSYAAMPMVDKGVFAYTSNGMYGVAFLGLWAIAFLFGSWNALVVAFFQHCFIWVHMYCTEAPDLRWIHGRD